MASVSVNWSGQCLPGTERNELLSYIRRLAEVNETLLTAELPDNRPAFLTMMSGGRLQGVDPRANVETQAQDIAGRILVNAAVAGDHDDLQGKVDQLKIPVLRHVGKDAHELPSVLNFCQPHHVLLAIEQAHIAGINFHLYDPRQLYPGEDRASFVFLHCPTIPFLDGCICEAVHKDTPGLIDFGGLPPADWYLRCPEVHLRYYLEDWFDQFLSWAKFFFMPELRWWRWEENSGFEVWRQKLAELQQQSGSPKARENSFGDLIKAFLSEAANCYGEVGALAAQELDNHDVRQRRALPLRWQVLC